MERITAQILDKETVLFEDIEVWIDAESRSGSFTLPPHKFSDARTVTVKASDGRSVLVILQQEPFDAFNHDSFSFTFIFSSGLFQ